MLKRLGGNKRSSGRGGEWRGLIEAEFSEGRKEKGPRSLEALHRNGRRVGECGYAVKSAISINNTHHMPQNCNSSHLPGPVQCVMCQVGGSPTEVIESGHENNGVPGAG